MFSRMHINHFGQNEKPQQDFKIPPLTTLIEYHVVDRAPQNLATITETIDYI